MKAHNPLDNSQLLSLFVAQSNDGYAIFDEKDEVKYVNQSCAQMLLETTTGNILGKTFAQIMKESYYENRGIKVNTNNIDRWLTCVSRRRWRSTFRSFEIDLRNGGWLLVSEQVIGGKFIFLHATDITRTKRLEQELLRSQSKLLEQAYKDDLTQIANRRAFMERGTEEIKKAHRHQKNLVMFLLDIDHFKHINDQFGHSAGDSVLISITSLIQLQLRSYDIFARIGGEEFALIFSDTDTQTAVNIVERIRKLIEKANFQFEDKSIQCTISFGGSLLLDSDDLGSIVSRVDDVLYLAKKTGRNRVEFS